MFRLRPRCSRPRILIEPTSWLDWLRDRPTSSGNPAMVHVNEKFGFRQTFIEVRTVKRPG